MKRILIALAAGLGMVILGASPALATPSPFVTVLWSFPAYPDKTQPQPYVASTPGADLHAFDGQVECGVPYQIDVYTVTDEHGRSWETLKETGALLYAHDGGFLAYNAGIGTPYRVITPQEIPCTTPEPSPTTTPSSPAPSTPASETPSASPSTTPSAVPTVTPSVEPTPTSTPSPTASQTPAPSSTPTPKPTQSPSPTTSPTSSPSASASTSPTSSASSSPTATATASPSASRTASSAPMASSSRSTSGGELAYTGSENVRMALILGGVVLSIGAVIVWAERRRLQKGGER